MPKPIECRPKSYDAVTVETLVVVVVVTVT